MKLVLSDILKLMKANSDLKSIEVQLDGHELKLLADSPSIHTIFRNLLSNAIKFSPVGSMIKIEISEKANMGIVSIIDQGEGIEADKIDKLFTLNKKSKRGTRGEKGTGLGLLLCKDLVELNKGELTVKSEVGKGCEFIVALPLYS